MVRRVSESDDNESDFSKDNELATRRSARVRSQSPVEDEQNSKRRKRLRDRSNGSSSDDSLNQGAPRPRTTRHYSEGLLNQSPAEEVKVGGYSLRRRDEVNYTVEGNDHNYNSTAHLSRDERAARRNNVKHFPNSRLHKYTERKYPSPRKHSDSEEERNAAKSDSHQSHHHKRPSHSKRRKYKDSSSDDNLPRRKDLDYHIRRPEELIAETKPNKDSKDQENIKPVDLLAGDWPDWSAVGGLHQQLDLLKECAVLPLLYPEIFAGNFCKAPRGVLLSGPPGTGKTLAVRALAGTLKKAGCPVSLFCRKGADVLSKYVGEGERQLRLLFEAARKHQPAIIFFDEIDGVAPVRAGDSGGSASAHHSSLVATLLALMDGLEDRGEQVIVIGATNRPDAVDPALRRPGRFDRELRFEAPASAEERLEILSASLRGWDEGRRPNRKVLSVVAERTEGFTGADLNALCVEAGMVAIRRTFPQVYQSIGKLDVSGRTLKVISEDFLDAMKTMTTPTANRTAFLQMGADCMHPPAQPLVRDLFAKETEQLSMFLIRSIVGSVFKPTSTDTHVNGNQHIGHFGPVGASRPGSSESKRPQKQTWTVPAFFASPSVSIYFPSSHLKFPGVFRTVVLPGAIRAVSAAFAPTVISVFSIDENSVCMESPYDAAQAVYGAMRQSPSILVIEGSCLREEGRVQKALIDAIATASFPGNRVLVVILEDSPSRSLSSGMATSAAAVLAAEKSPRKAVLQERPFSSAINSMFEDTITKSVDLVPLIKTKNFYIPQHSSDFEERAEELLVEWVESSVVDFLRERKKKETASEVLIELAAPKPRTATEMEQDRIDASFDWQNKSAIEIAGLEEEENHWFRLFRVQVRQILRSLCKHPRYAKWFLKPVDIEAYPDYLNFVKEPICLADILDKNDAGHYISVQDIRKDCEKLLANCEAYNDNRSEVVGCAREFKDDAEVKLSCIDDAVLAMVEQMTKQAESRNRFRQKKKKQATQQQQQGGSNSMNDIDMEDESMVKFKLGSRGRSEISKRLSTALKSVKSFNWDEYLEAIVNIARETTQPDMLAIFSNN